MTTLEAAYQEGVKLAVQELVTKQALFNPAKDLGPFSALIGAGLGTGIGAGAGALAAGEGNRARGALIGGGIGLGTGAGLLGGAGTALDLALERAKRLGIHIGGPTGGLSAKGLARQAAARAFERVHPISTKLKSFAANTLPITAGAAGGILGGLGGAAVAPKRAE